MPGAPVLPGLQADSSPGSERGPVALPVFKIGRFPLTAGRLGSTPRRFRHAHAPIKLSIAAVTFAVSPSVSTPRRFRHLPHGTRDQIVYGSNDTVSVGKRVEDHVGPREPQLRRAGTAGRYPD